jgi:hypothetical protein
MAMINGIRRKLGETTASGSWDSDQELKPETEEDGGPRTDAPVSLVAAYGSGRYVPEDAGTSDYYKSLVQTAIENGGRYGGHSISVPWLRMILAGLESKQLEPNMMWHGIEAGKTEREAIDGVPSYEDLFESRRDST